MQFQLCPGALYNNCQTKFISNQSCKNVHAMTVNACSAFPSKTLFDTLEDGTVLLGFTIEHINYAQRIVTMKEFIVFPQVFWETQDGNSVLIVQNLWGDKEDQIFKNFFDT